jgi:hypothetical protein
MLVFFKRTGRLKQIAPDKELSIIHLRNTGTFLVGLVVQPAIDLHQLFQFLLTDQRYLLVVTHDHVQTLVNKVDRVYDVEQLYLVNQTLLHATPNLYRRILPPAQEDLPGLVPHVIPANYCPQVADDVGRLDHSNRLALQLYLDDAELALLLSHQQKTRKHFDIGNIDIIVHL